MKSSARRLVVVVLACLVATSSLAPAENSPKKNGEAAPVVQPVNNAGEMRVQGEQRFRANCGRCHAVPQKFPPRVMGTIVRHMRVRALITDEDMRLVLFYMTQ
jgi:cytochrome c5